MGTIPSRSSSRPRQNIGNAMPSEQKLAEPDPASKPPPAPSSSQGRGRPRPQRPSQRSPSPAASRRAEGPLPSHVRACLLMCMRASSYACLPPHGCACLLIRMCAFHVRACLLMCAPVPASVVGNIGLIHEQCLLVCLGCAPSKSACMHAPATSSRAWFG